MPRLRKHDAEGSLEQNLHRLEEIVELLEQGEVPLEQSLKMYEEGVVISRKCMEILSQAEKKLKTLSREIPRNILPDDESTERE